MDTHKFEHLIKSAVKSFWETKEKQHAASGDSTNRGAVISGKQLDAFIDLLSTVAMDLGIPQDCIYTSNAYLPGFFRASKNWDFLIISPDNKLIAAIELKSQIGSYGNNFNNRAEEAIGDAVDLWTAFRENQFPLHTAPWIGHLTIVGKDAGSTKQVRNNVSKFQILPEFNEATYIDRYRILCQKLILERHYSMAALICTSGPEHYESATQDTSIDRFLQSFIGHLIGNINEFKHQ